jgi:hypothetical protein
LVAKETCSITQPMYYTVKKLDTLFNEARNEHPIETLINAADDNSISENKWSFDKNT